MKKQCGVNKNLYTAYNFEDHIWYQNKSIYSDYLYLTNRCVKIGSSYWMKKLNSDHWISLPALADAKREAVNTWTGATLPSGATVDAEMINVYFTGLEKRLVGKKVETVEVGSCPNIFQKMVVPMGPQFVNYKGQQYLNTWFDSMLDGNEDNLKLGKAMLLLCYASLCNGTVDKSNLPAEADRIYKMVVNNDYDSLDFRFLMNWLAAIVQNPGINLQTNVWLMGEVQGIGKGTLVHIMGKIIGEEFVGELNQTEIEQGWNDHLVGLQLVEINEFDTTGKMNGRAWDKWIKGHTVEPTLKIRERNRTSYTVLHIGNFIGVTNETNQNFIDANDRRNHMIRTTSDKSWVQYATAIQMKHVKQAPEAIASGFAFILGKVKVDLDFIAKSHKNQLRNEVAANNQTIVEEWKENDPNISTGKWLMSRDLYLEFKNWFHASHPSDPIPSETKWGRVMGASERLGVKKQLIRAGRQYMFDTVPVEVEHSLLDSVSDLNSVTEDSSTIVVYDLDEKNGQINPTAMTPVQKMRYALSQMKHDERDFDAE